MRHNLSPPLLHGNTSPPHALPCDWLYRCVRRQAHSSAVRSMAWSHSGNTLISGDHNGNIKYWQVSKAHGGRCVVARLCGWHRCTTVGRKRAGCRSVVKKWPARVRSTCFFSCSEMETGTVVKKQERQKHTPKARQKTGRRCAPFVLRVWADPRHATLRTCCCYSEVETSLTLSGWFVTGM